MVRALFDAAYRRGWLAFRLKPFLYAIGFPVREKNRDTNIQL
ncbi:MAG TPA: hypothetical protein VMU25_03920 [Candidatus Paceibacterota bacterium]|nr:hypothetical protein [Candidatus Paceibacterota bacterium]